MFMISSFINVLEPTPAADVVHNDELEGGYARLYIANQVGQSSTAPNVEPTLSFVKILFHDLDPVVECVLVDLGTLMAG